MFGKGTEMPYRNCHTWILGRRWHPPTVDRHYLDKAIYFNGDTSTGRGYIGLLIQRCTEPQDGPPWFWAELHQSTSTMFTIHAVILIGSNYLVVEYFNGCLRHVTTAGAALYSCGQCGTTASLSVATGTSTNFKIDLTELFHDSPQELHIASTTGSVNTSSLLVGTIGTSGAADKPAHATGVFTFLLLRCANSSSAYPIPDLSTARIINVARDGAPQLGW
jgi:hypothetical protein